MISEISSHLLLQKMIDNLLAIKISSTASLADKYSREMPQNATQSNIL